MPVLTIPLGNWEPDTPETSPGLSDISGFVPSLGGGYRTITGFTVVGHENSQKLSAGCFYSRINGNFYAQSVTDGHIYQCAPSTSNPDMTDVTSGAFQVNSLNQNPFIQFGDDVMYFNGSDQVKVQTSGSGPFLDLITSTYKPKPRFAGISNNHVVFANISGYLDGVAWSGLNDNQDFDFSLQTGAGDQRLVDVSGQIFGLVCGNTNLVFQESGVTLMTYEGTPFTFGFRTLSRTHGTVFSNSIVEAGRNVYFLAKDGFKRIVDRSFIEDIGFGRISSFLLSSDSINGYGRIFSSVSRMIGTWDANSGCIVWCYTTRDALFNANRNCFLIYDERSDRWSFFKESSPSIIGLCPCGIIANVDDQPLSGVLFVKYSGSNSTVNILAQTTSSPFTSSLPYSFVTKRLTPSEDSSTFVRAIRLVAKFGDTTLAVPTGTFSVTMSNDPSFLDNQAPAVNAVISSNGWVPVLKEGQFMKVSYSGAADSTTTRFFNQILYLQVDVEGSGSQAS